jgi:hypothetical protein
LPGNIGVNIGVRPCLYIGVRVNIGVRPCLLTLLAFSAALLPNIGVRPCLLTLLAFSAALLPCQENRGSNMPGLFTT